ncbi:MAG: hypothetical protein KGJ98_02740 [Chloroflexota bacterium]|nr:hypothetical protein [Chloroflexota bacterium]MDE3101133.1 hypothetical protein [Chloroflexota bacterium]
MTIGILVAVGVVCTILLALLLIFRRDLVGVDLSGRSLLLLYLYLASLAGVITVAVGVSLLLSWGTGVAFGLETAYGRPPILTPCPPGQCPDPLQIAAQYQHQSEQRLSGDLIGGLTTGFFGLLFYAGHKLGRRALGEDDDASVLHRAYVVLGTFVFGLSAIVLLPVGVYQALSIWLIPHTDDVFVPGIADSLTGGIVATPLWLYYLMRMARGARVATPRARPGPMLSVG